MRGDKYHISVIKPGQRTPIYQEYAGSRKDIKIMVMPALLRACQPPYTIYCVQRTGVKEPRPFKWKWNYQLGLFQPVRWKSHKFAYGNPTGVNVAI
jgi:hypothetical protein